MSIEGAVMPTTRTASVALIDNQETAALDTTRVIFFAGNAINPKEQYEQPELKGFGGMFLPQIKTLPAENKGMIYQCKFTPLRTTMIGEYKTMVPPAERTNGMWQPAFTKSVAINGEVTNTTVRGFLQSDPNAPEGEFRNLRSDHLLYRKRYPGTDIHRATERSLPNGVGGVVEIEALKGASDEEINAAQYFFFPNWGNITTATEVLPTNIRELEKSIRDRIQDIDTMVSVVLRGKYRQIGAAMLKSCAEYRRTGRDIVLRDSTAQKKAFTDGETEATHSEISGTILELLEEKRREDSIVNNASAATDLVREMQTDREANKAISFKTLLLEERKQYVAEITAGLRERDIDEEVRLGMRKAEPSLEMQAKFGQSDVVADLDAPPPEPYYTPSQEEEVEPMADVRLCGSVKANGEPCKRELKEGENGCFQHPK